MAVNLEYKHQQKTYELIKENLAQGKKVAYIFPVGCGKSFPPLKYIDDNKNKKVLIVVPSIAIKNQFQKYIHTYVENGMERIKNKEIQIVTYQKVSLTEKIEKGLKPDTIVFDEIHRIGAEKWEPAIDYLMEKFFNADVIGMSATPERTDKRNMAYEKFDNVVYEMSLTEALSGEKEDEVILQTPRYVRVISELKKEIAIYKEKILSVENEEKRVILLKKYEKLKEIISNFPDIQDVMEQGMKKVNGKYIVFCKDKEDMFQKMKNATQIFGKVNSKISMEYVLSKTEASMQGGKTPAENRKTLEKFEQKENGEELNLLFCVDMLNEGVHLEGIDGEIMFRPTESNILYKQQIGRVLSADKDKEETVIIDAVNNWLRQIETYREIEKAAQKGQKHKGQKHNSTTYELLSLTPEETDLLNILLEIGESLRYNNSNVYEEIIQWLETHEGKMPKPNISRNNEVLKKEEMTEEEQVEVNLYAKWYRSKEYKILKQYKGRPIEEIPEEYREKIEKLREYGIGLERKTPYEEIIEWLEVHEGKMPKAHITKDGKSLKRDDMTEEEKNERNLYARWINSQERKVLEEYEGRPTEEIPEEHREKIEKLREYGIGLERKTPYEEMIEWLETHNGKIPRSHIVKNRKTLRRKEMTKEENEEINLYGRWIDCKEYKLLKEYEEKPIEEVPEEYRDKIVKLRKLIQKGKDNQIKKVMRKAVGQHVGSNMQTREQLNTEIKKERNKNKKRGDN